MALPVMNVAFIVPNRNSNISDFCKIKMWVILVVVRSDPPYPHSTGLLSGKHPDWIIILVEWKEGILLYMATLSWIKALFRLNSTSDTKIFSKEKIIKLYPYSCCAWNNISIVSIIWDNVLHQTGHCWNYRWWGKRCLLRHGKKPGNHGYFVISESKERISNLSLTVYSLTLSFCSSLWWCPSHSRPLCFQEAL